MEVKERPVQSWYGDSLLCRVCVVDFVEIVAEKLRALIERGYPRDYYDVSAHIDKIDDKTSLRKLIERKCRLIGVKYEPENIFDADALARAEAAWKTQLEQLIPDYADFKTILPQLISKLSFLTEQK